MQAPEEKTTEENLRPHIDKLRSTINALREVETKLLYMRKLALLAADAEKTDADRAKLDETFQELKQEIDDVAYRERTDLYV